MLCSQSRRHSCTTDRADGGGTTWLIVEYRERFIRLGKNKGETQLNMEVKSAPPNGNKVEGASGTGGKMIEVAENTQSSGRKRNNPRFSERLNFA